MKAQRDEVDECLKAAIENHPVILFILKKHPRESYNEVISELVDLAKGSEKYRDIFLSQVQKAKMKDLWYNKEDEAWERA